MEEQNSQLQHQLSESSENAGALQEKLKTSQKELDEAKNKLKDDELALAKGHGKHNFVRCQFWSNIVIDLVPLPQRASIRASRLS